MLVRECYTEVQRNEAGELVSVSGERWVDMPGILTEAEGMERDRLAAIAEANEAIRQQLDALDARYGVRAMTDALNGDRTRLDALEAQKAVLRARLMG